VLHVVPKGEGAIERLRDIAEELDAAQAQRLRALVNDVAVEREALLA
jgi:hypothetical protein